MSGRIFALQVGINDYPANVGKLSGCLNDVAHFGDYLKRHFGRKDLRLETLLNGDATRANIIQLIRTHLGQAQADDVAIFQYSGHGARWKSAEAFRAFYPDGQDEGLVCIDSRQPGGFDLADKELAILLAEVAARQPHLAVILDCCHSGSATRGLDDFTQWSPRQTHSVDVERPLETYLDGYYATLLKNRQSLQIPTGRHVSMAACERFQKAWEGRDHAGVFTSTLLEVLEKSQPDISYADLFVRCRAAVRRRVADQEPQFETYGSFPAYSGFLGAASSQRGQRFSVSFTDDGWQVDCGALHGLPTDPEKPVTFSLYRTSGEEATVGPASTSRVGAQRSDLNIGQTHLVQQEIYDAELTSLPVAPLAVSVRGHVDRLQAFQKQLSANPSVNVALIQEPGAPYTLTVDDEKFLLSVTETGRLVQGVCGPPAVAAEYLGGVLRTITGWERATHLQNRATRLSPDDVEFQFQKMTDADTVIPFPGSAVTLDVEKPGPVSEPVFGRLMVNNRSSQPLHFLVVMITDNYAVQSPCNEPLEPVETLHALSLDGKIPIRFQLDPTDGDEFSMLFKLIVSTEKVDDFRLVQEGLTLGNVVTLRGSDMVAKGVATGDKAIAKLAYRNEWFTKEIHVKVVRQVGRIADKDVVLANQSIVIKGHPTFRADVNLSGATETTRGAGNESNAYRFLDQPGLELANFGATRDKPGNVLELSGIQNREALAAEPLEIDVNLSLRNDEYLLPIAFDGEFFHLVGEPVKDEAGQVKIRIHELPDLPDRRRSLGRALKLYFFKTYLGQKQVNRLAWIEYKADGTFERHTLGVADKVAAAQNVILLVHGIIGNTDSIVQGLRLAKDDDGKSVDQKFDLVLTYDYENLSTPISATALDLKQQLASLGLKEGDGKRLTLLVHSMGGLVSRWFIEREGGNKIVDHLVMFGTPNVGSPFGKVDSARKLGRLLTTLAINAVPVLAPYGGALVYLLNRSQKVTPTLEQMNADSEFITQLNASDDPGVKYSIVAGDVRAYDAATDPLLGRLLAHVAKGLVFETLYQNAGHDIAVSSDSIRGVAEARSPIPAKRTVTCHHLNYFSSPAGLAAMVGIEW